jgi:hypothetical protein
MGIFRKKTDQKTLEFLEKTDSAELFISSTVALTNGPSSLYSELPEGIGTLVLNNDGSGFIWKMIDMQGIPIGDEIKFDQVDSWGDLETNSLFDFITSANTRDDDEFEDEPIEQIYFIAGPWSIAVSEHPLTFSEFTLVSQWIKHHYPKIKFTRSKKSPKRNQ